MTEQYVKITERVKDAEPMIGIIEKVPEDKRELARLALSFYTQGMSDCLALCAPSAQQAGQAG